MNRRLANGSFARPRRPGLTLVEAAISIVLVGVLLVASLNAVGAAKLGQQKNAERGRGYLLAQELMSEIMRQEYADPEDVGKIDLRSASIITSALSSDSGESGSNRSDYDDVDDYNGWQSDPPQNKDGSAIPNLTGWKRIVAVERRSLADPTQPAATEEGLKHITVQITRDDALIAQLEAIKGAGLSPLAIPPAVLFVVTDPANLTPQEVAKQVLMESWGFSVELIGASALQSEFDTAVANADVAYVGEEIQGSGDLGTKLRDASIGVVSEEETLVDEFGFAANTSSGSRDAMDCVDNTHYITSPFAIGVLTLFIPIQEIYWLGVSPAPGLGTLGEYNGAGSGDSGLAILEPGAALSGGGVAAGRRVQLPWGAASFDINALIADGQTLVRRSIEWAARKEQP